MKATTMFLGAIAATCITAAPLPTETTDATAAVPSETELGKIAQWKAKLENNKEYFSNGYDYYTTKMKTKLTTNHWHDASASTWTSTFSPAFATFHWVFLKPVRYAIEPYQGPPYRIEVEEFDEDGYTRFALVMYNKETGEEMARSGYGSMGRGGGAKGNATKGRRVQVNHEGKVVKYLEDGEPYPGLGNDVPAGIDAVTPVGENPASETPAKEAAVVEVPAGEVPVAEAPKIEIVGGVPGETAELLKSDGQTTSVPAWLTYMIPESHNIQRRDDAEPAAQEDVPWWRVWDPKLAKEKMFNWVGVGGVLTD